MPQTSIASFDGLIFRQCFFIAGNPNIIFGNISFTTVNFNKICLTSICMVIPVYPKSFIFEPMAQLSAPLEEKLNVFVKLHKLSKK